MLIEILEEKKVIILDTNVYLESFKKPGMTLEKMLKNINYLYLDEKFEKILLTDGVYSEIELIKKGNEEKSQSARKVYIELRKAFEKDELIEYIDEKKHPEGVDDSLIDLCLEKDYPLLTFDVRTNIRYAKRRGIKIENLSREFDNILEIIGKIEKSKENLYVYIKEIFDTTKIDVVDYIKQSPEKRGIILLDFLFKKILKCDCSNNESLEKMKLEKIKERILEEENLKITNDILNIALRRMEGYNFGVMRELTLEEKNKDIIEKFLIENNLSSLEELERKEIFLTREEIINKILEKYNRENNGN